MPTLMLWHTSSSATSHRSGDASPPASQRQPAAASQRGRAETEQLSQRERQAAATKVYLAPRMLACAEDESLALAIRAVGFRETQKTYGATIVWNVANPQSLSLAPGLIFSRFPAMADCCRKALYASLLGRLRRFLPAEAPLNDGTLIPRQWTLPEGAPRNPRGLREYHQASAAAAKAAGLPKPAYIVKPDSGSQGAGIEVTTEPCRQSPYAPSAVVQEYIQPPLLLDGLKFDLRLYVLLTSVGGEADSSPLRAFLCREGMVRVAVDRFDGASLANVHAHLTNYSLNKATAGFQISDDADGGEHGSKRTVSSVFARLQRSGQVADIEALWQRIGHLISRALAVIQPVLASARQAWGANPCFQVLGFDVLLDADAKPWLVEINDHPSCATMIVTAPAAPSSLPHARACTHTPSMLVAGARVRSVYICTPRRRPPPTLPSRAQIAHRSSAHRPDAPDGRR